MKKLFFTSLAAMLCAITTSSVAQNDSLSASPKTRSEPLHINIPKFEIEEDLQLMTSLVKALDKDGLIRKTDSFKLEINYGGFSIDGKKQSKEITDKYRQYFRKDKTDNYTIINNGDAAKTTSNVRDRRMNKPNSGDPQSDVHMHFDGVAYQKNLKLMNQLISGLEKDGLLDSKRPYRLEIRAGELYINTVKQSKAISDKFRKYFQSDNYAVMND